MGWPPRIHGLDMAGFRDRLLSLVQQNAFAGREVTDMTSLIKSGLLDSLGLFNVALLVEEEVGDSVDLTDFDLAEEWDTVVAIEAFVRRYAASHGPRLS